MDEVGAKQWLAQRTEEFRPSIIQECSALAQKVGAINLSEGFPDFPAPAEVKAAAVAAIEGDLNQYGHVRALRAAIAQRMHLSHGADVDPDTEVVVCCGQTEAFAAAILAVVNPGDEVVTFEPAFETYASCTALAGGHIRFIPLQPPLWSFTRSQLESAICPRTKAIVVNSPHNPTGKVFSREELDIIAEVCVRRNIIAITDEVYEHITFDGVAHRSLLQWPLMRSRLIVTSSLSKTFSVTGWRVGWAVGPKEIIAAISNIHVKVTDSAPAPFQAAGVAAMRLPESYYIQLRKEYEERRDRVCGIVRDAGMTLHTDPRGSFFVFAEIPPSYPNNDVAYVEDLITEVGIATVPGCSFFNPDLVTTQRASAETDLGHDLYRQRYVRIAFCKDMATLDTAAERMRIAARGRDTPSPDWAEERAEEESGEEEEGEEGEGGGHKVEDED